MLGSEEAQDVKEGKAAGAPTPGKVRAPSGAGDIGKDDLSCPICLETIKEAFMTNCGHSFCYECIHQHLDLGSKCPICCNPLSLKDVFPNFALNRIIAKSGPDPLSGGSPAERLNASLTQDEKLSIGDINGLVNVLLERKRQMQSEKRKMELELLEYVLNESKESKLKAVKKLRAELRVLERDLLLVGDEQAKLDSATAVPVHAVQWEDSETEPKEIAAVPDERPAEMMSSSTCKKRPFSSLSPAETPTSSRSRTPTSTPPSTTTDAARPPLPAPRADEYKTRVLNKKQCLLGHFKDIERAYFSPGGSHAPSDDPDSLPQHNEESLSQFSDNLNSFSHFSGFRELATLKYESYSSRTSNIVSSVDFCCDEEFFATAGVTKKIKIFDYSRVIDASETRHFPVYELLSQSKLSCLKWNGYIKGHLVSSDYDGCVCLWDVFKGKALSHYDEHDKRIWSVDFSDADPSRFVSGSDDGKVKLWTTKTPRSVLTIPSKANVCSVQFNKIMSNQVAFGSADHVVHYYDLRKTNEALAIFKGHKKAVSYIKFINSKEFVSASTDSTCKLWNLDNSECTRTYSGHKNTKNFVGLHAKNDFFLCGSENNSIYTYHRELSNPILSHTFAPVAATPQTEPEKHFVSSVCWRTRSDVVVVGNSEGYVRVLEMQTI